MAEETPAPVDFSGKWKLDRSEKFEDFLAANGVNFMVRKMAGLAKPEQNIEQNGNHIKISIKTGFWDQVQEFDIGGKAFDNVHNGFKFTNVPTWDDKKLVIKATPLEEGKGKATTAIRELIDDELCQTILIDDVVCKRVFKRMT